MGKQTKRFSIVVGIDFSEMSTEALRVAVNLAHSAGDSIVHLVHGVSPQTSAEAPAIIGALEADARKQMAELQAAVLGRSQVPVTVQVFLGRPQEVLLQVATETYADLIVVGTHGRRGLSRLVFGSVAEAVTRTAPCSVLTVRPRVLAPEERIEPSCAECAEKVRTTADKGAVCARHLPRQHPRAHTYSELPDGFGLGSQSFNFPRG